MTDLAKLAMPSVHLNGTGKRTLLLGYQTAISALNLAIDAVRDTAPHGRDYYVQRNHPIQIAMAEHYARLEKLHQVARELEALAIHVSDQESRT
jgi:ethanolamine utilization cobalamin adenosyltransferase